MTVSLYDPFAEWYDAWLGEDSLADDPYFVDAESLMGEVSGQRICDLACGQGRVARHLADQGANVVGVDLSANLLAIARRQEESEPRGITYVHADAAAPEPIERGAFDGVVCHMALMDIPDLEGALGNVARMLRPDGWFVFTILHPCFNPAESGEQQFETGWVRTVSGYFSEGFWRSSARTGPPGKVGSFHRKLSSYVNALIAAGFVLEAMLEPKLEGSHAERRPVWAEVPAILTVRCRVGASRGN